MTAVLAEPLIERASEPTPEPAPHHPADPANQPHTEHAPYAPATPARYTQRLDGWTPDRQRGFLERIAEGATVDEASASVGLSPGAAYSLRRRAAGAAFALGWDAAKLVARPIVAETLFLRAIAGQTERVTRPDGEVIERHRYDNRLAMSLLNRLDRHADVTETANAATRMVAAEFDAFLDIIGRDAGPARAGLFLGERLDTDVIGTGAGPGAMEAAMAPILAPILALARADRWLRSAAGVASGIDVTDLDPAARAGWTAEQWSRAEAAGLLRLAPEPDPQPSPQPAPEPVIDTVAETSPASALPILHSRLEDGRNGDCPVWFDTVTQGWRTCFPPPEPYFGTEGGLFGDDDYSRECSDEEAIILEAPRDREIAERTVTEGADRDTWFVGYAIEGNLVDEAGAEAAGATDADRVVAIACAVDPLRGDAFDPEPGPKPGPRSGPKPGPVQSHHTDVPSPPCAEPEPKSQAGRSPAVRNLFDRDPHEHLQQDQVRNLW